MLCIVFAIFVPVSYTHLDVYKRQEIASKKNISIDTVKKHIGNIYRKLQVSNKVEAVNKLNNSKL